MKALAILFGLIVLASHLSPDSNADSKAERQAKIDHQIRLNNDPEFAAEQKRLEELRVVAEARILAEKKWNTYTTTSDIDDSTNAYVRIYAKNRYINGMYNGYPELHIQCRENSTQFYIKMAGEFLTDSRYTTTWGSVKYRIDSLTARTWSMKASTDNEALGLWNGSGIGQIKKLVGHDKLTMFVTPYNENTYTVEFDITGIEDRIKDVRENCHW